ncbi:hypothetical protein KIN20_023461 [Parelaphostrongylus tenuis]|uniref:Reverse transcriptase domain-containing protein n=1 Tax=Parelaphostrongylus tenuis TaxID=148309 RepID=A0AAD5N760_PARTN|nr:hypothetical protein KIN20_023461 [Parelaphostrongylus tenuis]
MKKAQFQDPKTSLPNFDKLENYQRSSIKEWARPTYELCQTAIEIALRKYSYFINSLPYALTKDFTGRYGIATTVHLRTAVDNNVTHSRRERIRIDGRFQPHLRFADDIAIISKSTSEAETMLRVVSEAEREIGQLIVLMNTPFIEN